MPFCTLKNADIKFAQKKLNLSFYTTAKALPTTKRIEIINEKKFTKATLDENVEAFILYMTSFGLNLMFIHSAKEALIVLLVIKVVQVPSKYLDFLDVF